MTSGRFASCGRAGADRGCACAWRATKPGRSPPRPMRSGANPISLRTRYGTLCSQSVAGRDQEGATKAAGGFRRDGGGWVLAAERVADLIVDPARRNHPLAACATRCRRSRDHRSPSRACPLRSWVRMRCRCARPEPGGYIVTCDGNTRYINGPESLVHLHRVRAPQRCRTRRDRDGIGGRAPADHASRRRTERDARGARSEGPAPRTPGCSATVWHPPSSCAPRLTEPPAAG